MSEFMLEAVCESFTAHGLTCERRDGRACVRDGLSIEPRLFTHEPINGNERLQLDLAIESPRLGGVELLESFAGIGRTRDEAEKDAFGKFLRGSFHVIAEALTEHRCDADQVAWEDWAGSAHAWRVCNGPVLLIATHPGAQVGGYPEFFPLLSERFMRSMSAGVHWMRVFVGGLNGNRLGGEVLVDGAPWPEGQQLLEEHPWEFPEGYASCRHLLIALPVT